jgi:hypothetical protein
MRLVVSMMIEYQKINIAKTWIDLQSVGWQVGLCGKGFGARVAA